MALSTTCWQRDFRPALGTMSHRDSSTTASITLRQFKGIVKEGHVSSSTSLDDEQQNQLAIASKEQHPEPPASHYQPVPLPPLLALPLELQQEIVSYLINSRGSELASLRGVNKYLYSIVTHEDLYKHALALLERKILKKADPLFKFLKLDDNLPCSLCLSLLPISKFHRNSRKKALGSKLGHTRFCMDCGIKHGRFGPGSSIKVGNKGDIFRIVCFTCLEFLDQPARFEGCSFHREKWYLRRMDNRVW